VEYSEGDYLAIRFVGHAPEYSDFLRCCFLNYLISCASVEIDNPHTQKYTITIQLTAAGVDRVEKLIHDFSGSILFRGKTVR
jgi:hypothetical protein